MSSRGFTRREFLKGTGVSISALSLSRFIPIAFLSKSCAKQAEFAGTYTTLYKTLIPLVDAINHENPDEALKSQFGLFTEGPGEPHILRNDLDIDPGTYENRVSLAYFIHTTDVHIIDDESPNRLCLLDGPGLTQSAYRPQDNLTVQVLNQIIMTANRFSWERPYDFAIFTGDSIDNIQYNELRCFIDTVDGLIVHPDSGRNDDPLLGPGNDHNDPIFAEGLDRMVPWYQVYGNHDLLVQGTILPSPEYNAVATGDWVNSDPTKVLELGYGTRNGTTPEGERITGYVPPDPDRRIFMTPEDLAREFFNTVSEPVGHGFSLNNWCYYAADPIAGLPFRMIALDTANRSGGANGVLDQDQIENFLIPELEQAQADNKLIMVTSHHPASDTPDLIKILNEYPNVFLHLVGHNHVNRITPRPGSEEDTEKGYWEVQTCALIDFPQQSRIIEIVDNKDGTGSIYCTMLNHNSPEGSLPYQSRSLSLKDVQLGDSVPDSVDAGREGNVEDRNVELIFHIPAEVEKALAGLTLPTRIESLTTLTEVQGI